MALVDDLIDRDGAACVWCGREPWRADLTAEHLLPRARGGRGTLENLVLACRSCNRRRRTKGVTAFVRAQLAAAAQPRHDLLDAALARLARSAASEQAAYGARQRTLLARLADEHRPRS